MGIIMKWTIEFQNADQNIIFFLPRITVFIYIEYTNLVFNPTITS